MNMLSELMHGYVVAGLKGLSHPSVNVIVFKPHLNSWLPPYVPDLLQKPTKR